MKRILFACLGVLVPACEDTALNQVVEPTHTLYADPALVRFDEVELGQAATRGFELVNGGEFALSVAAPRVSGQFMVERADGGSASEALALAPGEKSTFNVHFFADVEGFAEGQVVFTADGLDGPVLVQLIARAVASPVPKINVDPAAIELGAVEEGGSSARMLVVRNPGAVPISVQHVGFAWPPDPEISMSPAELAETELAPGESRTFELSLTPPLGATPGLRNGTVRVLSNVAGKEQIDVAIQGVVGAAGQLCVTPVAIDFGRVSPRLTKEELVHIENCADGPLSIGSLTFDAAGDPAFTIPHRPDLPLVLAARGDATDIAIRFAPGASPTATALGTVKVASDHGDGEVALRGERIDPRPSTDCSTIYQETHYCLTVGQTPHQPAIVGFDSGRLCYISSPLIGFDETASIAWLGHDLPNGVYGKLYHCGDPFDGMTEIDLDTGTINTSGTACTAVANFGSGLIVIPDGGTTEIFDELWYYPSFAEVLIDAHQAVVPLNYPFPPRKYYASRITTQADSIYMAWHSTHEIDSWDTLAYRSAIALDMYDDWIMGLAVTPDRMIAIAGWFSTPDIFLFDEQLGTSLGSVHMTTSLEGLSCVYNP